MIELSIQNGNKIYYPCVEEGVKLKYTRKGSPGQLTFNALMDKELQIEEGNPVKFLVDGQKVFYGYFFDKKGSGKTKRELVFYDQLRYFRNKDTYLYKNKTASQLLKMVCADFNLRKGKIVDTKYVIPKKHEKNKTLFDIIQNALDLTIQNKRKLYVLYDEFGEIRLTDASEMYLDVLICEETVTDYTYNSSIDKETYNKVKLAYENEKTGKIETYIAKDSANMNKWGTLQYFETEDTNSGLKAKADALLALYDRKTKSLNVKGAAGDVRVRAGCSVFVYLELEDVTINNFMMVDEVTHTFKESEHTMDLKLIGGDFV